MHIAPHKNLYQISLKKRKESWQLDLPKENTSEQKQSQFRHYIIAGFMKGSE